MERAFLFKSQRAPVKNELVVNTIPDPVPFVVTSTPTKTTIKNTTMAKKRPQLLRKGASLVTLAPRAVGAGLSGQKPTVFVKKGQGGKAVRQFVGGGAKVAALVGTSGAVAKSVSGQSLRSQAKQAASKKIASSAQKAQEKLANDTTGAKVSNNQPGTMQAQITGDQKKMEKTLIIILGSALVLLSFLNPFEKKRRR